MKHLSLGALAAALLVTLAPAAGAQFSCDRVYVDPANGNDSSSGVLTAPLATIAAGIQRIQSTSGNGTVVLMPGIYSLATNGEVYPIQMVQGISLQGTNALNTILDATGSSPEAVILFRQFNASQIFVGTFVNGLTITNNDAGAGVRLRGDLNPMSPTISNCFIVQNCAGISMLEVQPFVSPPPWVSHEPTIFHCTISDNEIGIHDAGATNNGTTTFYFGIGRSMIVNSLIFNNQVCDLLGVDGDDIIGSAFATSQVATTSCGGQLYGFPSISGLNPPVSIISVAGGTSADLFVDPSAWDYRLLPTTPLLDAGVPGPTWTLPNGNQAIVSLLCHPDATEVDAEGHGNPRFEGNGPDVGADERGQLIVAGYDPMTTTFSGANPVRVIYMNPAPPITGSVMKATHFLTQSAPGYTNQQPFGTPGINPLGSQTCIPRGGSLCTGLACVDPLLYVSGYPQVQTMDFLGIPTFTALTPVSVPEQYCLEIVPRNGNGSQETCMSNLQCYVVAP